MQDVVHFHGTYRYATRDRLEHAIASARAVLDDEDAVELDGRGPPTGSAAEWRRGSIDAAWMRCFVTRGTVLTVNLTSRVDRFSAAAVFELLAASAIEGAVEARLGDRHIDFFPSSGL
jgi:hypothetical protein